MLSVQDLKTAMNVVNSILFFDRILFLYIFKSYYKDLNNDKKIRIRNYFFVSGNFYIIDRITGILILTIEKLHSHGIAG